MILTSSKTGLSRFYGRQGGRLNDKQLKALWGAILADDDESAVALALQAGLTGADVKQAMAETLKKYKDLGSKRS